MNFDIDKALIQNLYTKKALLRQGDENHKAIRPVLLILSGAMRGVVGAGVTIALNQLGLKNVFDAVIGVSTGAGNAAYFLGGFNQSFIGAAVYYENLAKHFIRYSKSPIADVDYVEWVIAESDKKIDREAIMKSRTEFLVATTKYCSGEGVFLNAKKSILTMARSIKASIAMVGLYNRSVMVDDQSYVDGAISLPFPVKEAIEKFNPTDVLIISNASRKKVTHTELSFGEEKIMKYLLRKTPDHLKHLAMTRHLKWIMGHNYFRSFSGINKGIIWSPDDIHLLSRNSKKLKQAAFKAAWKTEEIFSELKK